MSWCYKVLTVFLLSNTLWQTLTETKEDQNLQRGVLSRTTEILLRILKRQSLKSHSEVGWYLTLVTVGSFCVSWVLRTTRLFGEPVEVERSTGYLPTEFKVAICWVKTIHNRDHKVKLYVYYRLLVLPE